MADLRVPLDPIFSAFGVPATVTRPAPDNTPITTTVVWIFPTTEDQPTGAAWSRRERQRMLALNRDDVPTVPRTTTIVCPERDGEDDMTWTVDSLDSEDADHYRVLVREA